MTGPSTPDLWAVIAPLCAAASVGTLASILVAVRQINPVLRLEFDFLSLAAGVVAAGVGWVLGRGLWRLGRGSAGSGDQRVLRRWVVVGLSALGILTVLGFVVASSGIPDNRKGDVLAGAAMAILALSAIGWLVWRLAKIFGQPDDPEGGAP